MCQQEIDEDADLARKMARRKIHRIYVLFDWNECPPATAKSPAIRIEIRRDKKTAIKTPWPAQASGDCATWPRG